MKTLVSIIIPCYNRKKLIEQTLFSVKRQSYQNWECIVVDDGSEDGSYESVQDIANSDPRIKLVSRNRLPKGAPTCRNIGIENATGTFILFLDSDDLMIENCLEQRIEKFKQYPEPDFLVFQSELFENLPGDLSLLWNKDSEGNDLERFLRTDALWPICGPIYKKEVFDKIGVFREDLPFYQDLDLHLRTLFFELNYKKFLDSKPDIYIRHKSESSISNSIPFTSDERILQQRTDFFLSQSMIAERSGFRLSATEQKTAWSVLYYFSSRLLTEHRNKKAFASAWLKGCRGLKINIFSTYLSYLWPYLSYWQRHTKYFKNIRLVFQKLFGSFLPDEQVLSRSSLFKIKIKGSSAP